MADYNEAINLNPKLVDPYNNRGVAYERRREYARALADFDQAIALDPKKAALFNNRC